MGGGSALQGSPFCLLLLPILQCYGSPVPSCPQGLSLKGSLRNPLSFSLPQRWFPCSLLFRAFTWVLTSISNANPINMGKDRLKAAVIFFPICVLKAWLSWTGRYKVKTWEDFLPLRKQLDYRSCAYSQLLMDFLSEGYLGKYWKHSNLTRSFRKSIDLPKRAAIDMFKVSMVFIPVCTLCIYVPFKSTEETPQKNQLWAQRSALCRKKYEDLYVLINALWCDNPYGKMKG